MEHGPAWHSSTWQYSALRHRKTAAERRQQGARAQGRVIQSLLRNFKAISVHRGNSLSTLGLALVSALGVPQGASSRSVPTARASTPATSSSVVAPALLPSDAAWSSYTAGLAPPASSPHVALRVGIVSPQLPVQRAGFVAQAPGHRIAVHGTGASALAGDGASVAPLELLPAGGAPATSTPSAETPALVLVAPAAGRRASAALQPFRRASIGCNSASTAPGVAPASSPTPAATHPALHHQLHAHPDAAPVSGDVASSAPASVRDIVESADGLGTDLAAASATAAVAQSSSSCRGTLFPKDAAVQQGPSAYAPHGTLAAAGFLGVKATPSAKVSVAVRPTSAMTAGNAASSHATAEDGYVPPKSRREECVAMHRIQAAMKAGNGALVRYLLDQATEDADALPLPFVSTVKFWLDLVASLPES